MGRGSWRALRMVLAVLSGVLAVQMVGPAPAGAAELIGATPAGAAELIGATPAGAAELVGATPAGAAELIGATPAGAAELVGATPAGAALSLATVRVGGGSALNVRTGPSTSYSVVRRAPYGSALAISCQVTGERIAGTVRTTSAWDRLADGRFISDAYVAYRGSRPAIAPCVLRATAQVSSRLNERVNASTAIARTGVLPAGAALPVTCQLGGDWIVGSARATSAWDRLADGRFISDAYVAWPGARPAVPWCTFSGPAAPPAGVPFIAWAAGFARADMAIDRVPASVTIAQAILESGWGRSGLTVDGNSYFGMKCFGTPGPVATGCRPFRTTECALACSPSVASFRVYASVWGSFRDHGRALATLPRYRAAMAYGHSPERFALELHRAGWATSPTYAQNLISLMRRYNLYRYDALP